MNPKWNWQGEGLREGIFPICFFKGEEERETIACLPSSNKGVFPMQQDCPPPKKNYIGIKLCARQSHQMLHIKSLFLPIVWKDVSGVNSLPFAFCYFERAWGEVAPESHLWKIFETSLGAELCYGLRCCVSPSHALSSFKNFHLKLSATSAGLLQTTYPWYKGCLVMLGSRCLTFSRKCNHHKVPVSLKHQLDRREIIGFLMFSIVLSVAHTASSGFCRATVWLHVHCGWPPWPVRIKLQQWITTHPVIVSTA